MRPPPPIGNFHLKLPEQDDPTQSPQTYLYTTTLPQDRGIESIQSIPFHNNPTQHLRPFSSFRALVAIHSALSLQLNSTASNPSPSSPSPPPAPSSLSEVSSVFHSPDANDSHRTSFGSPECPLLLGDPGRSRIGSTHSLPESLLRHR